MEALSTLGWDSMSYSSRKDSTGAQGFFGRMRLPKFVGRSDSTDGTHRVSEQASGLANLFRRPSEEKTEVVISQRGHELSQYGYEQFTVSDDEQIYITPTSERTMFNDGEEFAVELMTEKVEETVEVEDDIEPLEVSETEPEFIRNEEAVEETFDVEPIDFVQAFTPMEEEVEKAEIEAEDIFDDFDEPVTSSTKISIEDLFGNVVRGSDGIVETDVGIVANGTVIPVEESESKEFHANDRTLDSFVDASVESESLEEPVTRTMGLMEKDVEVDVYEDIESTIMVMPVVDEPQEIERIGSAEVIPEMDDEDDVPEVFVPKVEDFTEEAVAEESVLMEEVTPMLAAPVAVPVLAPAVSALALAPAAPVIALAPTATVLAIAAPVAVEAPTYSWDVSEEAAYSYEMFNVIEPDYATYSVHKEIVEIPWTINDEAIEAFGAFMVLEPEYEETVTEIPWELSEDAVEAFNAYMIIKPEYTRAPVEIPAWDVSEEAIEAYSGFQGMEEEYFKQAFIATLPSTIVSNKIEVEPLEKRIDEVEASALGITSNYAETTSAVKTPVVDMTKDNSFNLDNVEVKPEPKIENGCEVRASRFIFKDGRLQKVPVAPVAVPAAPAAAPAVEEKELVIEYSPAPEVKEESFRAPLIVEAEPELKLNSAKLVAKKVEGVNFSFGLSNTNCDSVRFSF